MINTTKKEVFVSTQGHAPTAKQQLDDRIVHQAIRPNRNSALLARVGHQFHAGRLVFLVKECRLPTIATLGYVMRQPRND